MMNIEHCIDLTDHIDQSARTCLDEFIDRDDSLDPPNLQYTIDDACAFAESFAFIIPDYNFPPDILHTLICDRIELFAHHPELAE